MKQHEIGTVVVFSNAEQLEDVTNGKEYAIVGVDDDGEEFFIDDKGDKNFSASTTVGFTYALGVYTVVSK